MKTDKPDPNLGSDIACDYLFVGKTVNAKCTLRRGHPSMHGDWRDPVTDEPI